MTVRIIKGDVREKLAELPPDHFDCIVTSPPYYGLRDYGTATWEGGDTACDHVMPPGGTRNQGRDRAASGGTFHDSATPYEIKRQFQHQCDKCGARRIDAQIGLETTLDAYLETIVAVCRELRRVLKPSGIMFFNIGDSYAREFGKGQHKPGDSGKQNYIIERGGGRAANQGVPFGLKPKDLYLVPERLGIALQADGWWVRSKIIWHKLNPMPESCADRPTSAHETIWMLTKSARYFWDAEAVAEELSGEPHAPGNVKLDASRNDHDQMGKIWGVNGTRNLRNVWSLASHPYPGAHFATFPPELAERCIKAGSSERGCCPECGRPWVRIIDDSARKNSSPPSNTIRIQASGLHKKLGGEYTKWMNANPIKTMGWQPSCKCSDADPIPARIIDPFAGAGTALLVADRLGRDAVGIELNADYVAMCRARIYDDCPMFSDVEAAE